jgi:hypothetical protein
MRLSWVAITVIAAAPRLTVIDAGAAFMSGWPWNG